jgi:hypothetical protein
MGRPETKISLFRGEKGKIERSELALWPKRSMMSDGSKITNNAL